MAQFSLYVHKGRLKPISFHFSYCYACSAYFPHSLKSYEHLHFSEHMLKISYRHVENMQGKTDTAIHSPHNNGVGSSMAIIILTIMWKITTSVSLNNTNEN